TVRRSTRESAKQISEAVRLCTTQFCFLSIGVSVRSKDVKPSCYSLTAWIPSRVNRHTIPLFPWPKNPTPLFSRFTTTLILRRRETLGSHPSASRTSFSAAAACHVQERQRKNTQLVRNIWKS